MKGIESLGLLTALCIALSSLAATPATRVLGAFAFTRWRMILTFGVLVIAVSLTASWQTVTPAQIAMLASSALVGVVLGDTALYAAMGALGPRRTSLLYAMSSPFSALLAFLVLGERLGPKTLAGLALILAGIALAVVFRAPGPATLPITRRGLDEVHGSLWRGIALGLLAAAGQGAGLLFTKAAVQGGHLSPLLATTVRVGFAAAGMSALAILPAPQFRARAPMTRNVLGYAAASGLLGMGVGATAQMLALANGGRLGVVATLSAMTPVVILPLLWIATRQAPRPLAWIGALLAACGAALVLARP